MAELDDDNVVGLDGIDDVGEASLDCVRARAAATNGFIDDSGA
jgi:hypothetical protein